MVVLACVLLHERGATASFRGVWHGQPAMQRWARLSPDCDVVTRSGRHLARSLSLGGHDAMRPSPVHTVHPGVLASWQCRPPPLESPPRVDLPLSLAGVSSPHVSSLTPRHAICLAADALRMRDGQAAQATALRHAPFCRDLRAATTPGAHGDRVLGLRCRRRAATKRHACSLGPATAMKRNRLARAALANETARVMQCAAHVDVICSIAAYSTSMQALKLTENPTASCGCYGPSRLTEMLLCPCSPSVPRSDYSPAASSAKLPRSGAPCLISSPVNLCLTSSSPSMPPKHLARHQRGHHSGYPR